MKIHIQSNNSVREKLSVSPDIVTDVFLLIVRHLMKSSDILTIGKKWHLMKYFLYLSCIICKYNEWDTQPFDRVLLLQQKINGTSVHLWASIFCFIRHHPKWVERSYNSLISVVKLPTLVNGMCRWMTFDYTRFAASPLVWVQDWFNKNNIPPCMCWEFHYKHKIMTLY